MWAVIGEVCMVIVFASIVYDVLKFINNSVKIVITKKEKPVQEVNEDSPKVTNIFAWKRNKK